MLKRMFISAVWLFPGTVVGQDSSQVGDLPEWLVADSILVQDPPWITATVAKDIVVLSFRAGTSATRRAAIIQQVHGIIVYNDRSYGSDGNYFIRVASHPDACGVKQALDFLDRVPEVETAGPDMLMTWVSDSSRSNLHIADGGLSTLPVPHKGSKRPCPSGTTLLR